MTKSETSGTQKIAYENAEDFFKAGHYHMEKFKKNEVPSNGDFAMDVKGDSLMPYFSDGQTIWAQRSSKLQNGEIGIFLLTDSAHVRIYTEETPSEDELEDYRRDDGTIRPKIVLRSLNGKYDPIVVNREAESITLGRVVTV